MGFWDIVAPAWTNQYREGELQRLQIGKESAQLAQSPYMRAWIENNPDSALAHSIAHVMGLPSAFSGPGTVHDTPAGQPSPAPADMRSSSWQTQGAEPYQPPPPPPPADIPGQTGPAQIIQPTPSQPLAQPRLIGPAGRSAYRYPQPADTPENVSMEATKTETGLHAAEEQLKRAQVERLQRAGPGGAAPPGYVIKGYDEDELGNRKYHYEPAAPGSITTVAPGTDVSGAGGGGGGGAAPAPAPAVPPRTPSGAAIPPSVIDADRQTFGLPPLTGTQPSGQSPPPTPSPTPPPSPAPGAPSAGATPPPAPGAPGAAPPGQVLPQTGAPPGTTPVSGPPPTAPPGVDAFGRPVTYTAPHEPTVPPGKAVQTRPGGPLIVTKPPAYKQERADMLTTLAEHNPQVRDDIQRYGVASALTIPANSHMVDDALAAQKAKARGAPSLTGQLAHVTTAINQAEFLGQPVQMPTELDGKPLPKDIAGKRVSPFSVLTKNAWYTTFGKRVPVLGQIFGPGFGLDVAAGKGDPRAVAIQSYAGAVQNIVRGFGDVGNLSEGEQKTVIDKLMPGENTTEAEATRKHQNLIAFLHVVQEGLQKAQQGGGTNVDGANVFRRAVGLPPIDAWSTERDDSRQGVTPAANVIGATPLVEGRTVGPAENQGG